MMTDESRVRKLEQEVTELRALFGLQWRRMGEATERWRAEDPEARALVMPDLGDLLQWLMANRDRLQAELDAAAAERDDALSQLDDAQCRLADLEASDAPQIDE
jgi:hypothetical protein